MPVDVNNSPPRSNPSNPNLKSTPQSRGSAAVSENIGNVGVQVSDVRPWIARDVENFTECSFDTMLKAFLEDCVDNSTSLNVDSFFDRSLDAMVRISNGEFNQKGLKVRPSEIRDHLEAYSNNRKMGEEALYPEFVRLVNKALMCLQFVKSDVPEIRPCDTSPICFHVNDPSYLTQEHQGKISQRKPDVVVVSPDDVEDVLSEDHKGILQQADVFLKAAINPPSAVLDKQGSKEKGSSDKKSFEWRTVRAFVEFKTYRRTMKDPPRSYTRQAYQRPPKFEYLTADGLKEETDAARSETLLAPPVASTSRLRKATSEPARRSPRHPNVTAAETAQSGSNSRKRPSGGAESDTKRQKTDSKRRHPVIVQAGGYAAEMFAAHAGRQHVVGLIIVDELLYIWRYDRQGAIQCSALDFIQDLPRFLLLLLAMQRFQDHNWGLNSEMDPTFERSPQPLSMNFDDHHRKIDVKLELSADECKKHYGLNGRATNVFPATSTAYPSEDGLIAKVFWVEESRDSEPDILKRVYEIAQDNDDVKGHVPKMVCYKVFEGSSTKLIRERLGINADHGSRVLYVIVFEKLKPITELVGNAFLHAWWETVKCHLALWKSGVRHRDISPYNLMYRMVDGKVVGVLNDFDLASLGDGVTGTERTGTVPFMAVNLLTGKALAGETEHLYEHDAESFIWVLTWITLRYDDGKFSSKRNPEMDKWLTEGAYLCGYLKSGFVFRSEWADYKCGHGHEQNFKVVEGCMIMLLQHSAARKSLEVDTAFEKLLKEPVEPFLFPKN